MFIQPCGVLHAEGVTASSRGVERVIERHPRKERPHQSQAQGLLVRAGHPGPPRPTQRAAVDSC